MTNSSNGPGTAEDPPAFRDVLRRVPVFETEPPPFDPDRAPGHPLTLFAEWLQAAIDAGVPEPHAMTLSTCDVDSRPDARVLILKDLTDTGLWFATSAYSAKARQLSANPAASLTFYWPLLGRQVRVRGSVEAASAEESAADFRARGLGARAVALASHESSPLGSRAGCADAVSAARSRLEEIPDLVATAWTLCLLRPEQVEFWQADRERQHTRLSYTGQGNRWLRGLLWP